MRTAPYRKGAKGAGQPQAKSMGVKSRTYQMRYREATILSSLRT